MHFELRTAAFYGAPKLPPLHANGALIRKQVVRHGGTASSKHAVQGSSLVIWT